MHRFFYSIFTILILSVAVHSGYAQTKLESSKNDSEVELSKAFQSAAGSDTQLIRNLEEYLKKYPVSENRKEIENEIYKMSVKMRDTDRALTYAEKFIAADPDNVEALTNAIALLRDRRTGNDLDKALGYANRLVQLLTGMLENTSKPKRLSAAQWSDRKAKGLASVYLLRGKVYTDMNNIDKARTDLLKSYNHVPFASTAVALASIEEKQNFKDQALDYYIRAFVISLINDENIDTKFVRKKINELYIAKNGSDKALGDKILSTYDGFIKENDARVSKLEPVNPNAGITDPLKFRLTKLDGSVLDMNSVRGKVVVLNFWATWCGPCRIELPHFEKTIEKYKNDKDVAFIAVSTDEDKDSVEPFLKQSNMTLPVAFADYLNYLFEVESIPTTIILDKNGRVSYRLNGFNTKADFVDTLSEKIEAAKK